MAGGTEKTPGSSGQASGAVDAGERVLHAAADLFAEWGYAGATTRAIAERAGVNEVTLFRRFGSKAGILRALGERVAHSTVRTVIAESADPQDARGTLLALARAEVRSAVRNGGLMLRLAFEARSVPEVADVLGTGLTGNLETLIDYLASRQRAGDLREDIPPAVLAEMFFALTSSLVMGRILTGAVQVPDTASKNAWSRHW